MFIELEHNSKNPILINVDRVRWVQYSNVCKGSTVVVFDNDDYLIVDESYEEVCKKIQKAQSNK